MNEFGVKTFTYNIHQVRRIHTMLMFNKGRMEKVFSILWCGDDQFPNIRKDAPEILDLISTVRKTMIDNPEIESVEKLFDKMHEGLDFVTVTPI